MIKERFLRTHVPHALAFELPKRSIDNNKSSEASVPRCRDVAARGDLAQSLLAMKIL